MYTCTYGQFLRSGPIPLFTVFGHNLTKLYVLQYYTFIGLEDTIYKSKKFAIYYISLSFKIISWSRTVQSRLLRTVHHFLHVQREISILILFFIQFFFFKIILKRMSPSFIHKCIMSHNLINCCCIYPFFWIVPL